MDWPKILLLTEVGLDDAVRNDNKSFTVKVPRSVNTSPKGSTRVGIFCYFKVKTMLVFSDLIYSFLV